MFFFALDMSELPLLWSNVYNIKGVHGIFCVFVSKGIGRPLVDSFPSGKFLTDLN